MRTEWRPCLRSGGLDPQLVSWLTESGSLTARCLVASRQFRVRLLHQGLGGALPDERAMFAGQSRFCVREVVLECDGRPVIYAHTVLPRLPRGRLHGWLQGLGSRSLGSLLFAHPGFRRDAIHFRRLDQRHALFPRAIEVLADGHENAPFPTCLWARRSLHTLGAQSVLVTEVFLPDIIRVG